MQPMTFIKLLAILLNLVLICTGVFQWLKLNPVWGVFGTGVGALNLLILFIAWRSEILVGAAAVGCLAAIGAGAFLGLDGIGSFSKNMQESQSLWDMIAAGHDLSYGLAYAGGGLITLIFLIMTRKSKK